MALHLRRKEPFGPGLTWITQLDEAEDPTGIALGVWRLPAGARLDEVLPSETAFLLMSGRAELVLAGRTVPLSRSSLFDESSTAFHASRGERVVLEARTDVELTVYRTANTRELEARIYLPEQVPNEQRGQGLLHGAAHRWVRTIFDRRNAPPQAELVLGEVVTFPGRWSSYPPHHHPQPEIYHYRFTAPQGYGHAELGETVVKVRDGDTIKILDGLDHPQCAAPGYGMWYAWVIRHLPGQPYDVPEFDPAHVWTSRAPADHWWPKDAG